MELRDVAFPIEGSADLNVPEPFVKQFLATLGVRVPVGIIVQPDELPSERTESLEEPLVLKAWGRGIVHKSELGAVKVGVSRREINESAQKLMRNVANSGIKGAGLYVEEMVSEGTELLFGIISKPPFGHLAILGIGGTNAEVLSDVCVRLCPLSAETVEEMIGSFRGAPLLGGYRGSPPVNREKLATTLLALGGERGLVDCLGQWLGEFECNPLFVSGSDAVVADARLILRDVEAQDGLVTRGAPDLTPLFAPRSVAIVGASSTRSIWGNRDIVRYRAAGWTENLYAVHPSANSIEGVPAYRSLVEIPGGVDYALISVPANMCPDVLKSARASVKIATINTIGFAETGPVGKALQDDLVKAAIEGQVRFLGPNCMGCYSPRGRQPFFYPTPADAGNVGVVLQSGGLATDTLQMGEKLGLRFSAVVSAGNVADIRLGDLVQYLVNDPDTHVIGVHVEGGADVRLIQAVKEATGLKPVVVLRPGMNETGARVAASHTGNLTSDRRGWEALGTATGVTLTETFEQFFSALLYLDRYRAVETHDDDDVLVISRGGASAVLAADACDKFGLKVPELPQEIQARLRSFTPVGYSVANPLDVHPKTDVLNILVQSSTFSDILVNLDIGQIYLQDVGGQSREPVDRFAEMLEGLRIDDWPRARIALVVWNLTLARGSDYDEIYRLVMESGLPMFNRLDEAMAAIAAAKRFTHYQLISRHGD